MFSPVTSTMEGQAIERWSSTSDGNLTVYMRPTVSSRPSYNQFVRAFLIVCDSVATERLRAELRMTNAWTKTIAATVARDAEFKRIDSILMEQLESGSYTLLKRCREEENSSDNSRQKIKITHHNNNTELNGGPNSFYAIAGGDLYSEKTHVQASSSFSLSDIVESYNSNNETQLPYAPQTDGALELKLHMTSFGQAMVHANTGETTEPVFMDDHLNEWRSSRHRRSLEELQAEYRDTIRLVARILSAPKPSNVQLVVQIGENYPEIYAADTKIFINSVVYLIGDTNGHVSLERQDNTSPVSDKINVYWIDTQITVGADYFNTPALDQFSDYRYAGHATVGLKNTDGSKKVHDIFEENAIIEEKIKIYKVKSADSLCTLYSDDGRRDGTQTTMHLTHNDSTFFSDAIYEKLYSCISKEKNIPRYLASELNVAMTQLLDQREPTNLESSVEKAKMEPTRILLTPVPPDERDSCGKTIAKIRFETGKHGDNFCWSIGHSPMPCLDAMLAAIACVHTLETSVIAPVSVPGSPVVRRRGVGTVTGDAAAGADAGSGPEGDADTVTGDTGTDPDAGGVPEGDAGTFTDAGAGDTGGGASSSAFII